MQMVRTRDESKLVLGYKRHRLNIIRYGVTANITAFHAVARGSIPRTGIFVVSHSEGVLIFFN